MHPGVTAAAAGVTDRVAQVDGGAEVAQVRIAAGGRAGAHDGPERGAARVPPDVGLGEQQHVDTTGGCALRYVVQLRQRLARRRPGAGRRCP